MIMWLAMVMLTTGLALGPPGSGGGAEADLWNPGLRAWFARPKSALEQSYTIYFLWQCTNGANLHFLPGHGRGVGVYPVQASNTC